MPNSDKAPTVAGGQACQPSTDSTSYSAMTMLFADGTNRITSRGAITGGIGATALPAPGYDSDGDIVSDATYQYTYDIQGHICASHTAYGMIGYLYDAVGHRVAKGTIASMSCDPTLNGFQVTNTYLLGGEGDQIAEMTGDSWNHTDVVVNGQHVATYDVNGLHFHFYDWLGTRRCK